MTADIRYVARTGKYAQDVSPWMHSRRRRLFDACFAAGAVLLLLPVLIAIATLVKLTSRGPVIFRQERVGRNGSTFTMLKFRSMHVDAGGDGPLVTQASDRRITRVGAFIRRYKLDELPQFFNVVRGDMSVVGPRPFVPTQQPPNTRVRPGITGAGSLAFRNQEQLLCLVYRDNIEDVHNQLLLPARCEVDSAYLRAATFRSDLRVILETICCVAHSRRKGPFDADLKSLLRQRLSVSPPYELAPRSTRRTSNMRGAAVI